MKCEVDQAGGRTRIRGEMTIYGAAALKDDLAKLLLQTRGGLTLDLEGVAEIDTTGVQMLLLARRECAARGIAFEVAAASAAAREALELLQLGALLAPANPGAQP